LTTIRAQLSELAHYRDLLFSVGVRTIKVRYKQSYLGLLWAIIQPIATMLVFTIVFDKWAKMDAQGLPYELFSLSALLPWTFFNSAVGTGSQILVTNANLIRKAYFPREVLIIAAVFGAFFDMLIAFGIFVVMAIAMGHPPGISYFLLIPVMLVACTFALAVCLILAPMNVFYRDIRHAVPLLLNLWLFLSPIAYSIQMPREELSGGLFTLYSLNPIAGIVEGFRAATLKPETFDWGLLGMAAAVSAVLCVFGYWFFKRAERTFADLI